MKAYKKWWNKPISDKQFRENIGSAKTEEEFLDALVEMVWRAALEEVLKHNELYIKTWIRKELEG